MQGAVPDANFEEVVAQTSAGDSVASSVQMQKLQQYFQYENALVKHVAMESFFASAATKPGLMLQDNSCWIGEGKGTEEEINSGMQGAVPDADCGVIQGLCKNQRQLANAHHRLKKDRTMKANNWQWKRKHCVSQLPEDPPCKMMKTDSESCIIHDKLIQDIVGNNQNTNQPNLYILHWHTKQQNQQDFGKKADTTDTSKFARSSIVHVLIQLEVDKLKSKGLVFIYLQQPSWSQHGKVELIKWYMDSTSKTILSTLDLQQLNIAIVTTYCNLKADTMLLAFVGLIPNQKPSNDDYILLGLFLQLTNKKSDTKVKEIQDKANVTHLCRVCDDTKFDINTGSNSNHHQSVGASYGLGA